VELRRFEPLTSAVQAPARFTAPSLPVLQGLLSKARRWIPAPVIAAEPAWTAHREPLVAFTEPVARVACQGAWAAGTPLAAGARR
jgi:hypothetical protein